MKNSLRRRHDSASLSKIAPGSQMDLNYFTPAVFPAFSEKSLCTINKQMGHQLSLEILSAFCKDGFKHLTQPPAMLPLETREAIQGCINIYI